MNNLKTAIVLLIVVSVHLNCALSVTQKTMGFDPLVTTFLPEDLSKKSPAIFINTGHHQVENISSRSNPVDAVLYQLLSYDSLEALPLSKGNTASMFNSKGIAKGTDRIEPYIFFSTGIPKVGSMRQRGHHPIKLLGKAYFDDPHLLNKSFIWSFKD
jgi:hypothetical protein